MISKEKYREAKEIIAKYEKQLDIVHDIDCWIMHETVNDFVFVTTNEEYAKKLYGSGYYTMRLSKIYNKP